MLKNSRSTNDQKANDPINVGILLSGGPAPAGHNVITGLYDLLKQYNDKSKLIGFKSGLDGLLKENFIIINDENIEGFRNSGGFDFLWSGRAKVNASNKQQVLDTLEKLNLSGLVIVGGDGSNSNAAILAEWCASDPICKCNIIGIPKTIDGDLKNEAIEISFGFDTASKTYSELVGNLCTDVRSGQGVWHFIRIMGRTASHLTLETALQTHPNLIFIGEEIEEGKVTLKDITLTIADLIEERTKIGKPYGIILISEGLIGFINEVNILLEELTVLLGKYLKVDIEKLSEPSKTLWQFLPIEIQEQLLGDREASGYVQVAKIATERLLIELVNKELIKRKISWNSTHHYFGYEGRCAIPSNFDCNYCYSLGHLSLHLILKNLNGYLTCIKNLHDKVENWKPLGIPFPRIMHMITIQGNRIPGIIRQLVDTKSELYRLFKTARKVWRLNDLYVSPGPIHTKASPRDFELIATVTALDWRRSELHFRLNIRTKVQAKMSICEVL
ncbi:pyrophosphate--fructose 6-phosphate 1-phosphotransferase-like [Dermatophagoides farinae]|uniref:pyrophosphate--fructose 6-phosphate 1-phosphotransferase-like n=1 Tax=Dermatophagoides farinae TaxID=6954 RepID=UPI003F5EAA74